MRNRGVNALDYCSKSIHLKLIHLEGGHVAGENLEDGDGLIHIILGTMLRLHEWVLGIQLDGSSEGVHATCNANIDWGVVEMLEDLRHHVLDDGHVKTCNARAGQEQLVLFRVKETFQLGEQTNLSFGLSGEQRIGIILELSDKAGFRMHLADVSIKVEVGKFRWVQIVLSEQRVLTGDVRQFPVVLENVWFSGIQVHRFLVVPKKELCHLSAYFLSSLLSIYSLLQKESKIKPSFRLRAKRMALFCKSSITAWV